MGGSGGVQGTTTVGDIEDPGRQPGGGTTAGAGAGRPRFSIVSAVYNVERYLPDYIASIEAQRFDLRRVEVIAVDDGSTDGSLAILEDWARRRPGLVTVVGKPNGGQGSARNLGLERAHGEWVTFTDPDDMLDARFLAVADRFSRDHPAVEVMAGKPIILDELVGRMTDTHPRRGQYDAGNRAVDLEREPNTFVGVCAAAFVRLDRVREQGLSFDTRIRPNFEDGHFVACHLLNLRRPVIGLLRDARYVYRKRGTGDSSLQGASLQPGRYDAVPRHGYLDLMARARAVRGVIPEWVQQLVVYELSWYLSADDSWNPRVSISPEAIPAFHELMGQVVRQLDPDVVRRHTARPLMSHWADVLAHAYRPDEWHSPAVARTQTDPVMSLQRLAYRHTGRRPTETFTVDGRRVEPVHAKTMPRVYYGRTMLEERILWLPIGLTTTVTLDGTDMPIRGGWPEPVRRRAPLLARVRWYRSVAPAELTTAGKRFSSRLAGVLAAPLVRRLARTARYRRLFGGAWVLIDRVRNADDNAERLFEHLRAERPDINAWFVIEKGTRDWDRLRATAGDRLVAYGSFRWRMLMLNCAWLASSHVDLSIILPPALEPVVGRATWRFAFLQHGVTKDDLSAWLNERPMDLFVVSTDAELESVVADGTSYVFTRKETRNTGLPRFDRLLAKARETPTEQRDLVLVAPTWRAYLTVQSQEVTHQRPVSNALWESDYLRNWLTLLRSPDLAEAAARRGWRVAFMPHPNFQPILDDLDLPPHVLPLTFADNDVQGLYARCALLVTDYSSVAFNIAYLDRPVVYFQFDRDEVFGGGHLGRRGYFDYGRDGFGPVATDVPGAVEAIARCIAQGPRPTPEYQERIDRTFPTRDGRTCVRVVAAIEEMSRPYRAD